jgi:predicted dehydrogenase
MTNGVPVNDGALDVAVVGLGNVGRRHLEAYVKLDGCRIAWVHDIDHVKAREIAAQFGGLRVAFDYSTIVDDPNVGLVSICSFDDDHFGQALAALKQRKHLFVEKPLCNSVDQARQLRDAWQQGGRPGLDSNLMSRGSPLYQWLATFVERGGLGEIYAIDAEYWYGRLHKITDEWRKDVDDYSVMQGGSIHLMDVVFMLLGSRPKSCFAVGNRICTEGTAFRYKDFVAATYRFPKEVVVRVTANFGCVHRHQHVLRVFGTRGTFLLDDSGARVHSTRDNITSGLAEGLSPALPIDISYRPSHKGALIPPLVSLIRSGQDTAPLMQRNLDVACAIFAADESVQAGKEVEVSYV